MFVLWLSRSDSLHAESLVVRSIDSSAQPIKFGVGLHETRFHVRQVYFKTAVGLPGPTERLTLLNPTVDVQWAVAPI